MASLGAQVTEGLESQGAGGNHLEKKSVVFALRGGTAGVGCLSRGCPAAGCTQGIPFLGLKEQAHVSAGIAVRVLDI